MIHRWKQFFRRPIVWIPLLLALLLNLAAWVLLLIHVSPQPDLIVLHYTLSFGVDMLGRWSEAFLIPALGLILMVANTFFARYFEERSHITAYFFLVMTPVVELIILLSIIFLVLANLPAGIL